ncbi:hypothetical protein NC652_004940 [Populus alba x Populus x berolinensis]|nr:hypothetical protein NC652_004940 [Populus alba x Populus x berolinensis]
MNANIPREIVLVVVMPNLVCFETSLCSPTRAPYNWAVINVNLSVLEVREKWEESKRCAQEINNSQKAVTWRRKPPTANTKSQMDVVFQLFFIFQYPHASRMQAPDTDAVPPSQLLAR